MPDMNSNTVMNIVHLIPSLGFGGGVENLLYHFCRVSDRSRFRFSVFYWDDPDDFADKIKATGVDVQRLSISNVVSLDGALKVAAAVRQAKAHVINSYFIDADLLGFMASRLTGVPLVMSNHSYPFPENRWQALRYRLMSGGMQKIICVSRAVKQHMMDTTGIREGKFEVIHNGVDRELFLNKRTPEQMTAIRTTFGFSAAHRVIGNVARLVPAKGYDYFLKAAGIVAQNFPEARFLIVGGGSDIDLKVLAGKLGIADRVVFAGPRKDVADILSIMDVFLFPTYDEAFGICLLEAMAAGVPVVASRRTAIPEIITDGKEGFLVPPRDEAKIADAVMRILGDAALSKRFALAGVERSRDFTLDAMVKKTEAVYERAGRR
ncbi:MAG: glycosyltransferase [Candidatus Omnitrophica bacterium]|nr:glycosyltransferase [Candidatus Omnitrophota bacterium]